MNRKTLKSFIRDRYKSRTEFIRALNAAVGYPVASAPTVHRHVMGTAAISGGWLAAYILFASRELPFVQAGAVLGFHAATVFEAGDLVVSCRYGKGIVTAGYDPTDDQRDVLVEYAGGIQRAYRYDGRIGDGDVWPSIAHLSQAQIFEQ